MLTQLVTEQIFYISLLLMQYNKNRRINITKQGLYFIRSFGVCLEETMIDFFFLVSFLGHSNTLEMLVLKSIHQSIQRYLIHNLCQQLKLMLPK